MKRRLLSLALAGTFLAVGTAQAEDLDFHIINQSSSNLLAFYTSPVGVDSWEENVFEGGYLPPGYEIQVVVADGRSQCDYDLRFEFEDGSVLEDSGDICEMASYTLSD
ncbi:hypothetical protein [Frigidibacter oleivorans]|uniref:hypothetical protein n=1 Tax=Frigidibacter oleivorans TaxID=2487129 RepID=UPI000F8CD31C|nr:hypothetical protein [Frigidibacter oleivorans]